MLYHSVGFSPLALPPSAFAEQVEWLGQNARVLSLEGLLDPSPKRGLSVAISFDDGYRGVHDYVAPLLSRDGFAATVYLSTSMIDDREHRKSDVTVGHYPQDEFLCWNEIARLCELGWTIGSHGTDHIDLTRQSSETIRENVARSRVVIEQRTGVPCIHFAYTWGRHDRRVRDEVARAGYASAVAGIHGTVGPRSNRFALPRIDVRRDYRLADFAALLKGNWDFMRYSQMLRYWFR